MLIMAGDINSFAHKYCLSSLAATVAETGNNTTVHNLLRLEEQKHPNKIPRLDFSVARTL